MSEAPDYCDCQRKSVSTYHHPVEDRNNRYRLKKHGSPERKLYGHQLAVTAVRKKTRRGTCQTHPGGKRSISVGVSLRHRKCGRHKDGRTEKQNDHHAALAKAELFRRITTTEMKDREQEQKNNPSQSIRVELRHGRTRRKMCRKVLRACMENHVNIEATERRAWMIINLQLNISKVQEDWHHLCTVCFETLVLGQHWKTRFTLDGQHSGTIKKKHINGTNHHRQYCLWWRQNSGVQTWISSFAENCKTPNQLQAECFACEFGPQIFAPISWMCKKQTAMSHSSAESEKLLGCRFEKDRFSSIATLDCVSQTFSHSDAKGNNTRPNGKRPFPFHSVDHFLMIRLISYPRQT